MPAVSVIIPVYNTEKYLRRCLDSVCSQTLKDIEVLAVDDGSTDGSAAILAERAAGDLRIRVIAQKNAGAGAARNVGIEAATGEYVGFVDSDDFVDCDFYEKLVSSCRDVVLGNLVEERYDDQGNVIETLNAPLYQTLRREALDYKVGFRGIFPVAVYRRELINRNGIRFAEKRVVREDGFFPLLAGYCAQSLGTVDETFYHYRCRDGSATRRPAGRAELEGTVGYLREITDFLRNRPLTARDRRFLVNKTFLGALYSPVLNTPLAGEAAAAAEVFYTEFQSVCDYREPSVRAALESVRRGLNLDKAVGRLELDVVRANAFRKIHKVA